ncbi:MAG: DNA polymerase III subunit beta [Gammaproteobacteria bacterium]|jgi:DNA polymerase-3 subunit beta
MKFTIQRESILRPLQLIGGVVERRQTLPILSNVLLKADSDRLTMTATDLEVELVISTGLDGTEAGSTTLPARKFMDICRALPDASSLEISLDKDRAVIRSGKSRFVLATLPAEEFPAVDDIRPQFNFSITQSRLKRLIERTHFAMAHQDVRYYLNGLLFEVANSDLRAVATDGHRLAFCQQESPVESEEIQQIIVPRKGVMELQKLLGESNDLAEVQIGTNHLRVVTDEMRFSSKLIDGRFPDYQRVIPQNTDKVVIAEREGLRQAVLRTSILTNEKYRSIRLQLESGTLRVLAHNPEQEEAEEEVAVDYDGANLEIGFNATYILDALQAVADDNVEIRLSDSNSCCLIHAPKAEDCKYVVMPMRL